MTSAPSVSTGLTRLQEFPAVGATQTVLIFDGAEPGGAEPGSRPQS